MVVVFHHFAIQVPPFDNGVLNQWIGNGNFMVNLFFVLSGFVLFHRYQNKDFITLNDFTSFYLKRAKRLLPLYFVGLLISLVYYVYITPSVDVPRIILAFTGVQAFDIWSFPVINVPSWSLSVEFFLYLLFPVVFMKLKNKSKSIVGFVAIAMWMLTEVGYNFLHLKYPLLHIDFIPLFSLASFVIGMAAYKFLEQMVLLKPSSRKLLAIVVVSVVIVVLYLPYFYKNYSGILAPLFGLLIVSLSAMPKSKHPTFWLDKLGDLSYPIYILHWPIYEIYGLTLEYVGIPDRHTYPIFLSYVSLVLLGSFVAHFVQKKAMKKIEKSTFV